MKQEWRIIMNERNSEMGMQPIDKNALDEGFKYFFAYEEKRKKIRCMNSTQRKRHQRQLGNPTESICYRKCSRISWPVWRTD